MTNLPRKSILIILILSLLIVVSASINFGQSLKENSAKLPPGLEEEHKFLKWINRWKERFPQVEADTLKRIDDGEIVSSTNPRYVFEALNTETAKSEVKRVEKGRYIVVSPDKLQYLDFRQFYSETKEATSSFVYYYGVRDNKVLKGPIFECKKTKCYFDRPFFLTPDLFYLPEVREKLYKDDLQRCERDKVCAYELILHEFDLQNNKRTSFVSSQLLTDFEKIQKTLEDY